MVLTVLCILPCLSGCGKNDKYEEQRVILDADLSQPGAICMQYRDLSFEIEQLQITDKESGVVTNSYSATLDLPEAREISALPVVMNLMVILSKLTVISSRMNLPQWFTWTTRME